MYILLLYSRKTGKLSFGRDVLWHYRHRAQRPLVRPPLAAHRPPVAPWGRGPGIPPPPSPPHPRRFHPPPRLPSAPLSALGYKGLGETSFGEIDVTPQTTGAPPQCPPKDHARCVSTVTTLSATGRGIGGDFIERQCPDAKLCGFTV